jgi:hypothetical protein
MPIDAYTAPEQTFQRQVAGCHSFELPADLIFNAVVMDGAGHD